VSHVKAALGAVDRLIRAAWVCPVEVPPIRDGWVAITGDRIAAVGGGQAAPPARRSHDLGDVALLPGLVNAHAHLELSWLRGRVPPAPDFLTWVGRMMSERTGLERADDPVVTTPMQDAIAEMRATGTVAVGDISNALVTPRLLAEADLPAVVFHELIGFRVTDGPRAVASARARHEGLGGGKVRIRLAPHAPFSVSRELFLAIRDAMQNETLPRTSVHVGESPEEVRLLADGSGPWRTRLGELGAWRDGWLPPGRGPADYLCDLGVLGAGSLAVHGVQLSDRELDRLAAVGATLVTCPRSNRWVGVGDPPIARFLASGVSLAVGTDSLASAPDLNLFGELEAMGRIAPEVPAARLIAAATRGGAEALGLGAELGTLAAGKRAILVAVRIPRGATDPERHLLSGVPPDDIRVLGPSGYDGRTV
jgi:aminodeoxyfutalosine deaminase